MGFKNVLPDLWTPPCDIKTPVARPSPAKQLSVRQYQQLFIGCDELTGAYECFVDI